MIAAWRLAVCLTCLSGAGLAARDAALAYWRNQALLSLDKGHSAAGLPGFAAADPAIGVLMGAVGIDRLAQQPAERARLSETARRALRADPLNPLAIRLLGQLQAPGSADGDLSLHRLAERVSRREVGNELVLQRAAAMRGDLAGALTHLDRAVSVAPELADQTFPGIAAAASNPDIRTALMRYASRPWYPPLVSAIAIRNQDILAAALLLRAAAEVQPVDQLDVLRDAIARRAELVGNAPAIGAVIESLPPADRKALEGFSISAANSAGRLTPIGWQLSQQGTIAATIDESGGLAVMIDGEQSGAVAERVTALPPGHYALSQRIDTGTSEQPAALAWELRCGGPEGRVAWKQALPSGGGVGRAEVAIPADCAVQRWRLTGTGLAYQSSSGAVVRQVALEPARP